MDKEATKALNALKDMMSRVHFRPGYLPNMILNMDFHTKQQFFFMCEAYMQQLGNEWAMGVGMQDTRMQPLGERAYRMYHEGKEQ